MLRYALIVVMLLVAAPAQAEVNIRFDDRAARVTLAGIKRQNLTAEAAKAIAAEQGNIALIRQANRFDESANVATFTNALLEIGNGRHLGAGKDPLRLQSVVENTEDVERLLSELDRNEIGIVSAVRSRVAAFSPKQVNLDVVVVFVVGGTSDGWAPASSTTNNEKKFYIALNMFKGDIGGLEILLSHELYHIVQSYASASFPPLLGVTATKNDRDALILLAEVTKEGTASLVGDATTWPTDGPYVQWYKQKFVFNLNRIGQSSFLLESVLLHVMRDDLLNEGEAYDLLFSASWESNAYFVGYYMAKYISDHDGKGAISDIISSNDPTALIRQYYAVLSRGNTAKPKVNFSKTFMREVERLETANPRPDSVSR